MGYIRDNTSERTGYQQGSPYDERIDFGNDFVMVYRLSDDMPERVSKYRSRGYVVHLMTGIAWGQYNDYLSGKWDGISHEDEAQTDRFGDPILHGVNVPYIVPTVAFADYLSEKLKVAVDAGVEAIHVEEPEFWDRGGYSESFKREYKLYYREDWQPPHSSVDVRYKASRLKIYLFKRTIERVSCAVKEYAMRKYAKALRFYVPTHSLLNYTQWKIMSPEGSLTDIPSLDGYIAQVWTGTSREKNVFDGVFAERTFETAYLEYGIMQELVRGTGRQMWFLHDPIEDMPNYTWENYRYNYLKTVTASLLHPAINTYEICPWPSRVFNGKKPEGAPDAVEIPEDYATLLSNIFQTLGDIECSETSGNLRVGVLLADSALCQRDYPDSILSVAGLKEVGTVQHDGDDLITACREKLFKGDPDDVLMLQYLKSGAFPAFYGMCLPLLKYGIPVRPVSLDNVRRYTGYLDCYDVLLMSYEYMKSDYPDINNALAAWVTGGGKLIYAGDGFDPFHNVKAWWNSGSNSYATPAEHLFELLGIDKSMDGYVQNVGKGCACVSLINPARFLFSRENADILRELFERTVGGKGETWDYGNCLTERRGTYIVADVMDESVSDIPAVFEGLFADMYTERFDVITRKVINPDEGALLYDFSTIESETLRIIGTSSRITSLEEKAGTVILTARGAADINAHIRIRLPAEPHIVSGRRLCDNVNTDVKWEYNPESRTALLSFDSCVDGIEIVILF